MKDEYYEGLLRQNQYEKGVENSKKMLAEGIELSLVAKITGLSLDELKNL
jgi:hypothetical protein